MATGPLSQLGQRRVISRIPFARPYPTDTKPKPLEPMSELDQEDPLFGEGAGDGAGRVTLSEAAQATEHVLEGCRRELQLLRRHLRGREDGLRVGEVDGEENKNEDLPSPRERALHLASRLEACAGALRNASTPER